MKCPLDDATLVMSERSGIEIDYCPECRGVWLDRGELDKILERASAEAPASAPQLSSPPAAPTTRFDRDIANAKQYNKRPKKREHWLMDLFD